MNGNGATAQKRKRLIGRDKENLFVTIKKSTAPRIRELRFSMRLFRKSPLAMIGLVLVLIVLMMALFAPFLAEPNPKGEYIMPLNFQQGISPPGSTGIVTTYDSQGQPHTKEVTYQFGTGEDGSNIYYGIIWGARLSITISLYVVLTTALIGVIVGALAGYYGGVLDEVLMRITDIFLSLPGLILAMAIVVALGNALDNILLALIIVWWPSYARLIRGQVLSIKENTYVQAARASGSKKNRILFRHIIPNAFSPMLVTMTMDIGAVVLVAAGLSFIGFGPPDITEWGRMVSQGQNYFLTQIIYEGQMYNPWWIVIFPGTMILIFVLGFNLLGDGLRDIMDPRLRR
jgi:peptide/nickel transport system permease protein